MADDNSVKDALRCLFDAYEPKRQINISFPLRNTKNTIDLKLLCAEDDNPGALQSGVFLWPAANALGAYIAAGEVDDIVQSTDATTTFLELGAGAGLAGLTVAKVVNNSNVILTDRDQVSLDLIDENIKLNGLDRICSTAQLVWGDSKDDFRACANFHEKIHVIIGSDLIYSVEIVSDLMVTVKLLMTQNKASVFILCSSFRHPDTTSFLDEYCKTINVERTVVRNTISCDNYDGDGDGVENALIERFVLIT